MSWKWLLLKKELSHEKAGSIFSILSVMLGVALIVATAITISSTKNGFLQMANEQNSGADLIATSVADQQIKSASFDTGNRSEINDAVPFFGEDSYYENGGTYRTLTLMAVDFTGERKCGGYKLNSGILPENGECLIPVSMETQYHLKTGDKLSVRTDSGNLTYKISGVVQNSGIATENFGKCVLTDINNMNGYGTMTYKLMLTSGTDINAEKASLQKAMNGKYTIDFPEGKTKEVLKEADTLFDTMMGFGLLTLLLGGFLINITVNETVRKMRAKFSILKVIGAKRAALVQLVLTKSLITGGIGATLGVAFGLFGSFGLIRLVDNSLSGGMEISTVFPITEILAVALGAVVLCLLTSLPASLRATKESIVNGFQKYDHTHSLGLKRIILASVLLVLSVTARILLGSSSVGKLMTFVVVALGIYFVALVAFLPCARLILKLINHLSPFNGFTVKNNLFKQSGKAINLAVLFSFVIAISLSIFCVVSEIADSTDRMVKGLYYGDAVVTSVTGRGINNETLKKIESAPGIDHVYPIYQKKLALSGADVQLTGYDLDKTNLYYLIHYWNVSNEQAQKLKDKNTVILSKLVLEDLNLKVGGTILIDTGAGMQTLDIVGEYEALNNDGRSGIISKNNFLNTFKDYSIRAVNVFKKNGVDFNTIQSGINSSVNDSFIQVDSVKDMQNTEENSDNQFIFLIDCMILVLVTASVLILVNSISMSIKNNEYSLSVTRLLGATGRNLILQNGIEGIIYGIFSMLVGEIAGMMLNWKLTASMNGMVAWNLKFTAAPSTLILFGLGFLVVALLAETISTAMNYKNDFKAALSQ